MSDADQIALSYSEEVTFGVTPAIALQDTRITSESLGQDTETADSVELVTDRQVGEVVRTNIGASGDVAFELSYQTFDDWLIAALLADAGFSAEVVVATADVTVSAASGDNSFNHSTGWDANPVVNEWIRVTGFVNAANNGFFKVLTPVTGTKIIVSGGTLVTEAITPSIDIKQGGSIVNGTTLKTYSLQKEYVDLAAEFEALRGMAINTLSLDVAPGAIITGSFGFVGKSSTSEAASIGTGGNTAANTNDVMNAVDDVNAILEGQANFPSTQFSMALENNLRPRPQIATLGPISLGTGKIGVSGTLQQYFTSKAVMDKYLAFSNTSLAIAMLDDLGIAPFVGNSYVLDYPRVRLTEGRRSAGGENQDIIADLAWRATKDPAELITMRIAKFDSGA